MYQDFPGIYYYMVGCILSVCLEGTINGSKTIQMCVGVILTDRTGPPEAVGKRGMSVCVPGQSLTPSNKYDGEQLRRQAHVRHIFSLIPLLIHPL